MFIHGLMLVVNPSPCFSAWGVFFGIRGCQPCTGSLRLSLHGSEALSRVCCNTVELKTQVPHVPVVPTWLGSMASDPNIMIVSASSV